MPIAAGVSLVGPVWTRHHDFGWAGRRISQTEWFFVGRLANGFASEAIDVGGAEAQFFAGVRWAGLAELAELPPDEIMAPARMAELLVPILAGQLPSQPIDAGV